MQQKIIPVLTEKTSSFGNISPEIMAPICDKLNRPLRDLRISVTDRCNFRCIYCMPKQVFGKDFRFIPHEEMLSFEEIHRIASIFVNLGIEKIRLTGGEPLIRRHIEKLIEQLAGLKTTDGKNIDLTLTTNASLLTQKASSLFNSGLSRITVSLDALNNHVFKQMNGVDFPVSDVLKGIEVAHQIGFSPIKINTVIKKGINDQEILPIARYFKNTPIIPRFIEYMDVGSTNNWKQNEIVPSSDVIRLIHTEMPLEKIDPNYKGETASRWRYQDGSGEIGVIASMTQAFCSECTRIRLSTTGKLYPCLFATNGFDLKPLLRSKKSDEQIANAIISYWQNREDRYSELRNTGIPIQGKKIEMSYIGG